MEQAHRPALENHLHRTPEMGPWVLISAGWYKGKNTNERGSAYLGATASGKLVRRSAIWYCFEFLHRSRPSDWIHSNRQHIEQHIDRYSEMANGIVAVASDHAGYDLKTVIKDDLLAFGLEVHDLGTNAPEPVDYPDFAYALARLIGEGKAQRGVLICGSGIGISIAANRCPAVRAALVNDAPSARMARRHNDANVICFGGRMIDFDAARDCLRVFLETDFEGERHQHRVDKLSSPYC